jgi:hypothetical protein
MRRTLGAFAAQAGVIRFMFLWSPLDGYGNIIFTRYYLVSTEYSMYCHILSSCSHDEAAVASAPKAMAELIYCCICHPF